MRRVFMLLLLVVSCSACTTVAEVQITERKFTVDQHPSYLILTASFKSFPGVIVEFPDVEASYQWEEVSVKGKAGLSIKGLAKKEGFRLGLANRGKKGVTIRVKDEIPRPWICPLGPGGFVEVPVTKKEWELLVTVEGGLHRN